MTTPERAPERADARSADCTLIRGGPRCSLEAKGAVSRVPHLAHRGALGGCLASPAAAVVSRQLRERRKRRAGGLFLDWGVDLSEERGFALERVRLATGSQVF